MNNLQKYNKFIVGVVGLALTVLSTHYGANPTFQAFLAIATGLGIYHVPNASAAVIPKPETKPTVMNGVEQLTTSPPPPTVVPPETPPTPGNPAV